jgi:hypothetical protein
MTGLSTSQLISLIVARASRLLLLRWRKAAGTKPKRTECRNQTLHKSSATSESTTITELDLDCGFAS